MPARRAIGDGMKRALIFQHMDHDHPGRFLDFFAEDDILPVPVRLFEGQSIPVLAEFDLLFVLGGAQDTWQDDQFPWMKAEKEAIREWVVDRAKPYVGVCLGHQLLCDALGGVVAKADTPEVGVHRVELTEAGGSHPLTKGVPQTNPVLQWHFAEVKRAPDTATVLARSAAAAVQCVAVGDHAIGTQFHCEFSPQTLAGWSSIPSTVAGLNRLRGPGGYDSFVAEAFPLMPGMRAMTYQIYENLVRATGLRPR